MSSKRKRNRGKGKKKDDDDNKAPKANFDSVIRQNLSEFKLSFGKQPYSLTTPIAD
jgi:hypothetical protein